jgi:hypothetical protein
MEQASVPDIEAIRTASPDELPSMLAEVVREVRSVIDSRPHAEAELLRIIGDRLSTDVNAYTWQQLTKSLSSYLSFGTEFAFVLAWAATEPDEEEALRQLEATEPEATVLVRRILGLYGREVKRAFTGWERSPHDWTTVVREVHYDILNAKFEIRLKIEHYGGHTSIIEGSAESIMTLARHIILTLHQVGTRDAFPEERIDDFLTEARAFIEMLSASPAVQDDGTASEQHAPMSERTAGQAE